MRPDQLKSTFSACFPDAAAPRICRAPGRVNLLGEHIDYSGLPVLPMTLDRHITIAFAPRSNGVVHLRNTDPRYATASFQNGSDIHPSPTGAWENYCKAAVQGLNRRLALEGAVGMDMLVTGTVPEAAGLSSSSALVVASALAYLAVNEQTLETDLSRLELASLLAEAEHYVGTHGGGMDQAVLLLGGEGRACKIDFFPLRVEHVPLFEDFTFVVCNSLVTADKTGAARDRYNEGPLTCRLIRAMVERQAQIAFGEEVVLDRLADLWFGPLCLLDREVEQLLKETFPAPTTSLEEAARFLQMAVSQIRNQWLGDLPEPKGGFPLQARARHQLTEFQRVEAGRDMMIAREPKAFGALMNASHESCAHDYRVSCPELERLVTAARKAGSIGSRLTGAGFGGCTINLVPSGLIPEFCERLEREYYAEILREAPGSDGLSDRQMVAIPGPAAGYE